MNFPGKWLCISIKHISILTLLAVTGFALSAGRSAQKAQNLGPEDPSKVISVTVWLNQHNKATLDELVREMYRPGSPTYHHFLTHAQYLSRFAPTTGDAAQVREYLTSHNLTVTAADKLNHYMVAQGRVSDVQNAFSVQLSRVSTKDGIHRVTNRAASVPGAVRALIRNVQGLADFAPKPMYRAAIDPSTGSAPRARTLSDVVSSQNRCLNGTQTVSFTTAGGPPTATYNGNRYATDATNTCPGYNPSQLQTAFGFNPLYNRGWDGTGQTIIIIDAYGSPTIQQDANTFSAVYGLPPLTSSNFQVYYPGGVTTCSTSGADCNGWNTEVTIDVEWAHALAPGANIALVVAPDNSSLDIANFWAIENPEVFTSYANGDLGYVISNSWGAFEILDVLYGGQSGLYTEYAMTELAAALGISDNFSSGDDGDNVQAIADDYGITVPPSVQTPASAPYATGVGGISLFLNSSEEILHQTGWGNNLTRLTYPSPNPPYDPPDLIGFYAGAGGGSSAEWPEPAFQSSLGKTSRQVPDIALLADPYTGVNIIITVSGLPAVQVWGGTSVACPQFSALWAIANQAAGSAAPLGQAAAMLYSLPSGAITDVVPVNNGLDVKGKIVNPPNPVLVETAADLAQPLENTTVFLSALYHGSSTRWYDITFGTDSSLVTAPGWDNVTGLGTPNGLKFVEAVVAAAGK
ncbi:MAG: S53 family peptidase [Candidatus Sulfotelmatobacter sp.]